MSRNDFLVVIDPTREQQPALDRAIQSAKLSKKHLHLFECVNNDYREGFEGSEDQTRRTILTNSGQRLADYMNQAIAAGVDASSILVWNEDWMAAVVGAAKRLDSFMVFKSSFVHSQVQRTRKTSDWTLLRECPCPVMLVHESTCRQKRRVLAAVNLAAEDQAHLQLNEKIRDIALGFGDNYRSDVHFVNCLLAADAEVTVSEDDGDVLLFGDWDLEDELTPNIGRRRIDLDCAASELGVKTDRIHLVSGNTVDVILQTAEQLEVDLIIVGTVRRTGIKSRVIGNTAEKLLDRTNCDILTLA